MNPQIQAILAGLGNNAMQNMGTVLPRPQINAPPTLPPGMPLPQASQAPGGGMGVPAGHEITIKGPPPPKAPEMAQPSKPKTMPMTPPPAMSPGPTPQQQNPGLQLGMPPGMPNQNPTAGIPSAPIDPLSLIKRLFGGPAAMQGTPPTGVPGSAAGG